MTKSKIADSARDVKSETDTDGRERWVFTVDSNKFGVLSCSYYPEQAQWTLMQYFKKNFLASDWFNKTPLSQEQMNALDPNKVMGHPLPLKNYEYSVVILQRLLPQVLNSAIRQAVHETIHRTLWDLNEKTHHFYPQIRQSDTAQMAIDFAVKDARRRMSMKRGPRGKITERKLHLAFRKLGNKAGQTDVASELNITDRALRKHHQSLGLTWPQFRSIYTKRNK